jgi:hypothetical protein
MWLAALPFIVQALPGIVQGVEALFSHKPKSGPTKKQAVIGLVQAGLQVAGHIPLPSKDEKVVSVLGGLVDVVVADLQQQGLLATPPAAPAATGAAV